MDFQNGFKVYPRVLHGENTGIGTADWTCCSKLLLSPAHSYRLFRNKEKTLSKVPASFVIYVLCFLALTVTVCFPAFMAYLLCTVCTYWLIFYFIDRQCQSVLCKNSMLMQHSEINSWDFRNHHDCLLILLKYPITTLLLCFRMLYTAFTCFRMLFKQKCHHPKKKNKLASPLYTGFTCGSR